MKVTRPAAFVANIVLSGILVASLLPASVGAAPAPKGKPAPSAERSRIASLDSRLARFSAEAAGKTEPQTRALGKTSRLHTDGKNVTVIVRAKSGQTAAAKRAVKSLGGTDQFTTANLIQCSVPVGRLKNLATSPEVLAVRPPLRPVAAVASEGVSETGAALRHAAGNTGSGVKVGILDGGFAGLDGMLGAGLPSSVVRWEGSPTLGPEGLGTDDHGTAVAEIVHSMAPGAQLYVAQFGTELELQAASQWMVAQGVNVINMSMGYVGSTPGDGTGLINGIVDQAVAQGVFWANSAGNERRTHWRGDATDANDDRFIEFAPGDDDQIFSAQAGDYVGATLTWKDSWTNASQDYDLGLYRYDAVDGWVEVAWGDNVQDGTAGCEPREELEGRVPVTGTYAWCIYKYMATSTDVDLDLFDLSGAPLEHQVSAYSIVCPADNPSDGFMAVGAIGRAPGYTQASYSSEGPTRDGRVSPEISAPSGVHSSLYGVFDGTSASSPHLAGAAALILERAGSFTPAQLEQFLKNGSEDLGAPGPDNAYGYGRLSLPQIVSPVGSQLMTASPLAGSISAETTSVAYRIGLRPGDDLRLALSETSGPVPMSFDVIAPDGGVLRADATTADIQSVSQAGDYLVRVHKVPSIDSSDFSLTWARVRATGASVDVWPPVANYGGQVTVTAVIVDSDEVPVGAGTVLFQRSSDNRRWTTLKAVPLVDGAASAAFTPSGRTYLRAAYPGVSDVVKPSTSAVAVASRYAYLTTPSAPSKATRNRPFAVAGYLRPKHTAGSYPVKVRCYRYENSAWVLRKTVSARASTYNSVTSRYAVSLSLPYAGRWMLKAAVGADSLHAGTTSGARYVSVNPTSISASQNRTTATYGIAVKLTGVLKDSGGRGIAYKPVILESSDDGSTWVRARSLKTSSKGVVSTSVKPTANTYYRFRFAGDTTQMASVSSKRLVKSRYVELTGYGPESRRVYLEAGAALVCTQFGLDYGQPDLTLAIDAPNGATMGEWDVYDVDGSVYYDTFRAPVSGYYLVYIFTSGDWAVWFR